MFVVGDVLNTYLDNIFKILGNIKLNFTFNFLVYDNIFFHRRPTKRKLQKRMHHRKNNVSDMKYFKTRFI